MASVTNTGTTASAAYVKDPKDPKDPKASGPAPEVKTASLPVADHKATKAPETAAPKDEVHVAGHKVPDGYSEVTADSWKHGPNDCMEHILKAHGYSKEDIYKPDANGKSLLQKVAEENGLKDPNLIRDGQKLIIPNKEGKDGKDGKKTEKGDDKAKDDKPTITRHTDRSADGTKADTETKNGGASTTQHTEVGKGGHITGSTHASRDGKIVSAHERATNAHHDASLDTITKADSKGTHTTIRETDGGGKTEVTVNKDGITAENRGVKDADDKVKTQVKGPEKGPMESLGESIGNWGTHIKHWWNGEPNKDQDLHVTNAKKVEEQRGTDGSRHVTVTDANGKKQEYIRDADGVLQRAGRRVDHALEEYGKYQAEAYQYGMPMM